MLSSYTYTNYTDWLLIIISFKILNAYSYLTTYTVVSTILSEIMLWKHNKSQLEQDETVTWKYCLLRELLSHLGYVSDFLVFIQFVSISRHSFSNFIASPESEEKENIEIIVISIITLGIHMLLLNTITDSMALCRTLQYIF